MCVCARACALVCVYAHSTVCGVSSSIALHSLIKTGFLAALRACRFLESLYPFCPENPIFACQNDGWQVLQVAAMFVWFSSGFWESKVHVHGASTLYLEPSPQPYVFFSIHSLLIEPHLHPPLSCRIPELEMLGKKWEWKDVDSIFYWGMEENHFSFSASLCFN